MGCHSLSQPRWLKIIILCYNVKNVFDGDAYIYSKKKLSKAERTEAMQLLEIFSYSCGSSLNDIHCFEDDKDTVLAKLKTTTKLTCNSHITAFFVKGHRGKATIFPENP